MLAMSISASLLGLTASRVRVEVEAARGIPSFELVGLAEAAVRESRVRVKSALAQVGVDLSEYRVIVNLAPADEQEDRQRVRPRDRRVDAGALGAVPAEALAGVLFLGELVARRQRPGVRGVLPQLLGAPARVRAAIVPRANQPRPRSSSGIDVRTVASLGELRAALHGGSLPNAEPRPAARRDDGGRRPRRRARAGGRAARARDRGRGEPQPPA